MDWNTYLRTVKRKWENRENEMEDEWMKRRKVVGADMTGIFSAIAAAAVLEKDDRKKRGRNIIRDKSWWTSGMKNWSDSEFKKRVRINRKTFEYLLERISPQLRKTPTNLNQDPIEPHRQLGLTLYRMGHGCSYTVIEDLFGTSVTLAANTFTKVIRVLIHNMYDEYQECQRNRLLDKKQNTCKLVS